MGCRMRQRWLRIRTQIESEMGYNDVCSSKETTSD